MDKYSILKKYFGYDQFRPIQEKAINSVLEGNDTIVLLATGGGKSIIFQVPALLLDGITIVVTPLISLMVDQVRNLRERGIAAEYINSNIEDFELNNVYNKIQGNAIKILYVSAERLQNPRFIEAVSNIECPILCLDESHSIESRIGFRPAYGKIDQFITKLKKRPILLAVTATASEETVEDLKFVCKMNNPNIFKSSFDRPNLYYGVEHTLNKLMYLEKYLNDNNNQGIIYCSTRREVEKLYNILYEKEYSVTYYHGGMESEDKKQNQDEFSNQEKRIMISTISFGLGIDIPNIRFVIVYDIPSSIEDLVQMMGRCSRDGKYGEGIVLYDKADIKTNMHYIYQLEQGDLTTKTYLNEKIKRKNKVYEVIKYCKSKKCLHNEILKYFKEIKTTKCMKCSNCLKK